MICLIISLVGFWPSYVAPTISGIYHSPSPAMQWHVLCSALWLALLVVQPWLVQHRQINLHRRVGVLGVLVAAGLVITGVLVQLDLMAYHASKGDAANAVNIPFIRFTLLLRFAVCVSMAIALRHRPDWHKRLIVLGTHPLLQSSFDRLAANVLGWTEIRGLVAFAGHMGLMALFVVWDRRKTGYLHPITKWATLMMFLFYFLSPPVAEMEWWRDVAANIAYRFSPTPH
jgi:hypothetical protein